MNFGGLCLSLRPPRHRQRRPQSHAILHYDWLRCNYRAGDIDGFTFGHNYDFAGTNEWIVFAHAFFDIIYQINDVKKGVGKNDPFIRPGEIVIVTEGEPIYITGAVVAPQPIVMKDGMTLGPALAMAGGPKRQAKTAEIHVYRQKEGKIGSEDLTFNYDAIRKGKQQDVLLQAYDIIDVRQLGALAPRNLSDMVLGMGRGVMGVLPYRVIP